MQQPQQCVAIIRHGIAKASRQSASQPELHPEQPAHPPHGIAERPERHDMHPCAKRKPPTDHGIARASHLCGCPNPTRWYRRSVPTVAQICMARLFHTTNASRQQPNRKWRRAIKPPGTPVPNGCPDRRQPARDNLAHPTHGIAEASHDPDSNPRVSRMVSQKRPKGSVNPRVHVPWCRRSVPRSTEATSVPPGVRHLAAPRSVGPRCRPRKNSAHQYCRPVNFAKVSCC